jgi:hypothetical protein
MIFPTDVLHSRTFGPFEEDRQTSTKDFQSLLLHAIFGENVSNSQVKPTSSIPSSTNAQVAIDINRYCKIYNLIAIISYYTTGARTLILDLDELKEQCFIDPFLDCTTTPETTINETTINETTCNNDEERHVIMRGDFAENTLNLFEKELFVASVDNRLSFNVSDSGSVFTKFEDYIKQYGKSTQETYNARVDALATTTVCHRNLNRNLNRSTRKNKNRKNDIFNMLSKNVNF